MLLVASLLAAATLAAQNDVDLAKVNGEAVTSRDVLEIFTDRHSGHARFLGGEVEARTFLNILIEDRLLIQEAYNIGLDQDAEVRKIVGERESADATKYLITSEIDKKAVPTKDEVRAIWEKELGVYVKVRQISVETKEEADEIRTALLAGGDFDALVACSRAESRFHGGHAMVTWGQFDPEWERVVFAMQPGEISPPIETPNGYDVVILGDRPDMPRADFDKIYGQIEAILHQRKVAERKKLWADALRSKYHVATPTIDLTPAALLRVLATAPDTILATWDGGGKLTLKETFTANELRTWLKFPPVRARNEIDSRIRATVNGPLVDLEAKALKIAELPQIATEVRRYREYIMESVLFRDHIFRTLAVSDSDLKAYYDAHKSEFIEPEQRRVAQILVASEDEANKVRQQLDGGADFDQVAQSVSRDFVSSRSGGDLGWITPDKVPPSFKEVLTLGKGELAKPVRTANGWHIIKVTDIKSPHQLTIDEAKDAVRQKALDAKQRAARAEWVAKLRAASKIDISDAAIKQFVKENEFKGDAPPQHAMQ